MSGKPYAITISVHLDKSFLLPCSDTVIDLRLYS